MRVAYILLGTAFLLAILLGLALGLALAGIKNYEIAEQMDITQLALPTQVFDIKGRLITEFFSNEKREIIPLSEIPQHLVNAIITREDQNFYSHLGFSPKGILRAAFGYLTGNYQGGGSTLTIQVAGHRHADRTEFSLSRKVVELWYALLLEKLYSKNEILEFYLNEMPFGGGTNGVEAASKFYFKKTVKDITLAESVLLINALASHTKYSPLKNPEVAKERQRQILNEMVALGYTTKEEAEESLQHYWNTYDYTRFSSLGSIFYREDKAPWFSEYVRELLEELLLGSQDIYRGGLKVYTTLDLDVQKVADKVMTDYITRANNEYQHQIKPRLEFVESTVLPLTNLLSLAFNIDEIHASGTSIKKMKAEAHYLEKLNPMLDMLSTVFSLDTLASPANLAFEKQREKQSATQVEGALISLGTHTGHIQAMIGGKEFNHYNQFNRTVKAKLQPGSAFKPLYYCEAINSKKFTPGTVLKDRPTVFWNDDGTPYTPLNYVGNWHGNITVRDSLALSLNIPSLKILEGIGFDPAIKTASRLLGVNDPIEIEKSFPRKFPLGLGIASVSPLGMARAFATFPNLGREIEPIAIRYVQDKNGKNILEPEKEIIARRKRAEAQILSPQAAYLMVNIMQSTVEYGTLNSVRNYAGGFGEHILAGKTGTTQNWSDGWAVGFSNHVTTAVWFGFDTPGNSLGRKQAGANVAGWPWGIFMKEIHKNLPPEPFPQPLDGIINVAICKESGLLPDPSGACTGYIRSEVFISGTAPHEICDLHRKKTQYVQEFRDNLQSVLTGTDFSIDGNIDSSLPFESLPETNIFDVNPNSTTIPPTNPATTDNSGVPNPLLE
jgi:penicillin-binding protein 1A